MHLAGLRNLLLTLLLLTTFVVTSILAVHTARKATMSHPSPRTGPDFFMNQAVYTRFNSEGKILNRIHTAKITHFPEQDSFHFATPHLVIYTANTAPWQISAQQGRSEEGQKRITLWDHVKIIRQASPANPRLDIATDAAEFFPTTKVAQTDQAVTILENGNRTHAIGAKIDFKKGIVKLISQIESWYQVH